MLNPNSDSDLKLAAVIVTTHSDGSQDQLFDQKEQNADEGFRVSVYQCPPSQIPTLKSQFASETQPTALYDQDPLLRQMLTDIESIDSDCVLFNFECCGGCDQDRFMGVEHDAFEQFESLVNRGFQLMFSDFSLKYLINHWDVSRLGNNPFVKLQEQNRSITLTYDRETLLHCMSTQLEKLAKLSDDRCEAHVHAMGGTVAFTVDSRVADAAWELQVLTVATQLDARGVGGLLEGKPHYACEVNGVSGIAGHVALQQRNKGALLLSSSHWIELSKFDVSEDRLKQELQESNFEEQQKYEENISKCRNEQERSEFIQMTSNNQVQKSMPCQNISRKAKSKKY